MFFYKEVFQPFKKLFSKAYLLFLKLPYENSERRQGSRLKRLREKIRNTFRDKVMRLVVIKSRAKL